MVTSLPVFHDARLADGQHEIVDLGHRKGPAIDDFIFQEDHRIGIADRRLEQALGVGGGIRRDHRHAGHRGIPGGIILAVLGADAGGGAVGAAEHDGAAHLPARHVAGLGGGIDDLVHRLHGEIPGHEFHDRLQAVERRAHAQAGKAMLGDGRVDDAALAELLQQALRNLVGALVLGDFLAHQEHQFVAAHFLRHGVAQRVAHRHGHHFRAGRQFGIAGRGEVGQRRGFVPAIIGGRSCGRRRRQFRLCFRRGFGFFRRGRRRPPKHPRHRPEAWRWAR